MAGQLQLSTVTWRGDLCGAMVSGMGVASRVPPKLYTSRRAGLVISTTKRRTSIGAATVHDNAFMSDGVGE